MEAQSEIEQSLVFVMNENLDHDACLDRYLLFAAAATGGCGPASAGTPRAPCRQDDQSQFNFFPLPCFSWTRVKGKSPDKRLFYAAEAISNKFIITIFYTRNCNVIFNTGT